MNRIIVATVATALLTTVAVAFEIRHPNLKDAYGAADNAIHHIQEAQSANKGIEFGGHAEQAIRDLQHAQQELIMGDKFNDEHHK